MNKTYRTLIIILTAIILYSCSAHIPMLSDADAEYAHARWATVNKAKLTRGMNYYAASCHKCHGLKNPKNMTEDEWRDIMPKMQRKAKIADTTADIILAYVLTARNNMLQTKKK